MLGNFRFKLKGQDKVYGAICNPFVGGYVIIGTSQILKANEVEKMIKDGEMIIV